jgi:hypothetical protein
MSYPEDYNEPSVAFIIFALLLICMLIYGIVKLTLEAVEEAEARRHLELTSKSRRDE